MTRSLFGTPLLTHVKLGILGVCAVACDAGAVLSRAAPPERAKAKIVGLSIDEWERGERRFSAIAARAEVDLEPYRVTTGPVLATIAARGETRGRRFVIEAESARLFSPQWRESQRLECAAKMGSACLQSATQQLGDRGRETEFTGNVRVASDKVSLVAEKLIYDARRGAVRLEGGVRATGPRGRVLANRVAANLAADEATFEGNVRGTMLVE